MTTIIRNGFGLLVALALASGAAFGANDKIYTATGTPTSAAPGTSPSTVIITLVAPNSSNSSFNSFSLLFPTSGYTVSAANATSDRGTLSPYPGGIQVNTIASPVGTPNETIHVTITNVTTSGACGTAVSGQWVTQPYTGSPVPQGQKFTISGAYASTSIYPLCYTATSTTGAGDGAGTITPPSVTVLAGNTATFSVTPHEGSTASASGCGGTAVTNSSAAFQYTTGTVPQSGCTVTATFNLISYQVTATKTGNGFPATAPQPQNVKYGQTTTFDLTAAANSNLIGASDTCNLLASSGSLSGNTWTTGKVPVGGCMVTANYALKQYTVTPLPGANGSMSPSTAQTVTGGNTQAFTVTANAGYYISATGGTCGGTGPASGSSSGTYTTNAVTADCNVTATFAQKALSILNPVPTQATVGTPFNVLVGINPANASAGVTMSSNCGATVNGTPTYSASGDSVTFSLTIPNTTSSGSCAIAFDAAGYTQATLPTSPSTFTVVGNVDCSANNYASTNGKVDPDLTYVDLSKSTSKDWGVRRGPNLDDLSGGNCSPVNVQLITDGNSAHFIYDKSSGQKGLFKYTVVWNEQDIDASGDTASWTNNRPKVAWVTTDYPALTGSPVYVPALACVDDDLLQGALLMPVLPSVEPFVGTPGTASDPANAWAAEYTANGSRTAKMCIASHGWISNLTKAGVIQVIYVDKFVDMADSYAQPK